MKTFPLGAISLLSVIVACHAHGQSRPFTLQEYITVALSRNPLIASADFQRKAAEYGSSAIRKGYEPRLTGRSHVLIAPTHGYDPVITNGGEFAAQIGLDYLLFDGGARDLQIMEGDLGVRTGTLELARAREEIILSVSRAFGEAAKEKRRLNVAAEDAETLAGYLQLVTELHLGGTVGQTDVLKTTVEYNNARIEQQSTEAAYHGALLGLALACGEDTSVVRDVDSTFAEASCDTAFVPDRSPDLAIAGLQEEKARVEFRIARARLSPAISLGADAGALTSLPNLQQGMSNVFGGSAEISFEVPITGRGALEDQSMSADLAYQGVAQQEVYLRRSLETEFAAARLRLLQSRKQLQALEENLSVARQGYDLLKAKYAGGGGSSIEVLDAIRLVHAIRLSIEETRGEIVQSVLAMRRLSPPEDRTHE